MSFNESFEAFCAFGDRSSDGKTISLSNSDKWMKQANIFSTTKISTTDTSICFSKLKSKRLTIDQYKTFIEDLAKYRAVPASDIFDKLTKCGLPGLAKGATTEAKSGVTTRLTDTAGYTGAHKERFDESGKGKGKSGRVEEGANDGYVGGFKGKGTYDKTH